MEKLQQCGLVGKKIEGEAERETIVDMLAVSAVMSGLTELEHKSNLNLIVLNVGG